MIVRTTRKRETYKDLRRCGGEGEQGRMQFLAIFPKKTVKNCNILILDAFGVTLQFLIISSFFPKFSGGSKGPKKSSTPMVTPTVDGAGVEEMVVTTGHNEQPEAERVLFDLPIILAASTPSAAGN